MCIRVALEKLLDNHVFGLIGTSPDGKRFAHLKELGISSKLKNVEIRNISSDSILIKLDAFDQQKAFKVDSGLRKRCDYILFTSYKGKKILLFIEMKSSTLKNFKCQFNGARCIVDYCNSALNYFFNEKDIIDEFEQRYVLLHYRPVNKKSTPKYKPYKTNSVENCIKISLHTKSGATPQLFISEIMNTQ